VKSQEVPEREDRHFVSWQVPHLPFPLVRYLLFYYLFCLVSTKTSLHDVLILVLSLPYVKCPLSILQFVSVTPLHVRQRGILLCKLQLQPVCSKSSKVCVCVCVYERERERDKNMLQYQRTALAIAPERGCWS